MTLHQPVIMMKHKIVNWGDVQQRPIAPTRSNVIVFPSASHHATAGKVTTTAAGRIDAVPVLPTSVAAARSQERLVRLENTWLDLTADIANFMELDPDNSSSNSSNNGMMMANVEEGDARNSTKPLPSPDLILPDLDEKIMLDEEDGCSTAALLTMNANLRILEDFIDASNRADDECSSLGDSFDNTTDLDTNQSLIDEVESFLLAATGGEPTIITAAGDETDEAAAEIDFQGIMHAPCILEATRDVGEPIKATSETVAEKNSSSSHILKALVEGKVLTAATAMDESSDISLDHLTEEDLANAYTTTIKTETGQDVIIIITQPGGGSSRSPAPSSPSPSPSCDPDAAMLSPSLFSSPDYHYASSSDYEWSPSPAAATRSRGGNSQPPQRKKYQRKNKPTLVLEPYPRDKTERKKAQNRTAAFRYREKKKAELDAVDTELDQLTAKNIGLRARLRDMEQELRCLTRLMTEAGLGHLIINNEAAALMASTA